MLENIQIAIQQGIEELFANAYMDEITKDIVAYKEKLKTISQIAELLGVDTEVTMISINIRTGDIVVDGVAPKQAQSTVVPAGA